MELVEKAREIAHKAHEGQVRKTDGSPYVHHPEAVAEIVKEHGFGEEVVAAALVHDVLEDCDMTETELREELGDEVVNIVTAVSENKDLEWEDRKEQYAEAVASSGEGTMAVSVADKIHNAKSLLGYYAEHGPKTWDSFNRGKEKKVWFEKLLLTKLQQNWQHPLLDEYASLVEKLESLD